MVSGSVVKRDGGKVGPRGSSERKPGAPMAPEAPLLGNALHKMERFSCLGRLPDHKTRIWAVQDVVIEDLIGGYLGQNGTVL